MNGRLLMTIEYRHADASAKFTGGNPKWQRLQSNTAATTKATTAKR